MKDGVGVKTYSYDEYDTVADFVETHLSVGQSLWHGHLCLAGDLLLDEVAQLDLQVGSGLPAYWLRTRGACVRAGYIHLIELVLGFTSLQT